MANDISALGIGSKSSPEIKAELTRFAKGDFSDVPFGQMGLRFKGITPAEMERTAKNALSMIDKDFGGDAHVGLQSLQAVIKETHFGNLDFNELVETGNADRLMQLERQNPQAFFNVAKYQYSSQQQLGQMLDSVGAPGQTVPVAHQQSAFNQMPGAHDPHRASLKTGEIAAPQQEASLGAKPTTAPHAQQMASNKTPIRSKFAPMNTA